MLTRADNPVTTWDLMGQSQPPSAAPNSSEIDLWPYRTCTVALLRRYARTSVEMGRLPSLLGREFFRARLTSYAMKNFEDVVVFVTDMERSLEKLTEFDRKLLAINFFEEYSIPDMARLIQHSQRSTERLLQQAIDEFSHILLDDGLLHELPFTPLTNLEVGVGRKTCQEGNNYKNGISHSKQGGNKM